MSVRAVPGLVKLRAPVGAIWVLYLLGYHVSVAVRVGLIALMGGDAETGVFMLLYLEDAYEKAARDNRLNGPAEPEHAVLEGAARRVRPELMTAAPMIGGIVTPFGLELLVYPAVYHSWKSRVLFGRFRNETPR